MRQIATNLKGHVPQLVLGPLFKLLEAILELCVPLVMAGIIDVGVAGEDTGYVLRGGLVLLGLAAGGVAAALICQYFAAMVGGRFGLGLRRQLYGHVMRLGGGETARFGAGGLITRVTNDTNQIQAGINMFIRLGIRVPFLIIGGLVMALRLNLRMGLVFLVAMPVVGLVLFVVMKLTLPSYGRIQAKQDELARLTGENLAGARVIRAFSRQRDEEAQLEAEAEDLRVLMVRVGRISAVLNPVTGFVASLAIVAIVWLGGGLAFRGESSPGQVIAMVSYMNQIVLAMVVAANLIVLFTRAIASVKRVEALLAVQPSVVDGPGAKAVPGAPVVAFKDVWFGYHQGAQPALEGVSFEVGAGETVGIIGGTGSGKTTLMNLLLRYYDPGKGQVLVDGNEACQYTLAQLRGRFGLVPQTAGLFSGSVRDNLLISAPGADDEAMWRALRAAQAEDFVADMAGGLDAALTEEGKNLSGGQRQRLTIARALVRRPQILILDDAASALDYATDARLRKALRQWTAEYGMTVLMVSQRAASLRHADRIVVMDDGRLAGSGTHAQLLATNAVYREICQSQGLGGEAEGRGAE